MSHADELLKFIVAELLLDPDDDDLTVDDELLVTERIDSLGLMRLIAFIGEQFAITVPYDEILIENFRSISTIDSYLAAKTAAPTS
ncbi:MAG: phosphopantetheine-binding protein [Acidimicrobiales bacterium]